MQRGFDQYQFLINFLPIIKTIACPVDTRNVLEVKNEVINGVNFGIVLLFSGNGLILEKKASSDASDART